MKYYRLITTATVAALLMAGIAGCAKTEESQASSADAAVETTASSETSEASTPATAAKFFVTVNGFKLDATQNYNDIKDKLGKESKPSEKYEPCDPTEEESIYYFYEGVSIEAALDGRILAIRLACDDAKSCTILVSDAIKAGDTLDDAVAKFGDPASGNEYSSAFVDGNTTLIANFDENTKVLNSFEIYGHVVDLT